MAVSITPSGTELQISESSSFSSFANEDNGTYRTQQAFEAGDLPYGVDLYARVRHNSIETGWSAWSSVVSFHIETPASIIGIAIDTTANGGTLTYIDAGGNQISKPDLLSHAAYKNISMVVEDSDRAAVTMTKFGKFYIKTSLNGPAGSFAENMICLWISDMPFEGFRTHPAFKRMTNRRTDGKYMTSDFVYLGTYCGHSESVLDSGTCLGSKKGATIETGTALATRSNLMLYCSNRNNTNHGQAGWRSFDIWDLSLVRWLGLFLNKNFNFQAAYGTNIISSPKAGDTACKIIFQGTTDKPVVWLDDLWSAYYQHINLIAHNNGIIRLFSPMDGTTELSIGGTTEDGTMAMTSGYIQSFCSASFVVGDEIHDLLELFLPKTTTGSESAALVPDYYTYSTESQYMQVGGYWNNSTQGGMFCSTYLPDSYQESYQSWEIIDYETITNGWPTSRRCGHIFLSANDNPGWRSYTGTTDGNFEISHTQTEQRCDCPLKYGPFRGVFLATDIYSACCSIDFGNYNLDPSFYSWAKANTCPKGWGNWHVSQETNYAQNGQGYVTETVTEPVYGYVTRYRDVYYNYVAARIAKS